MFLSFNVFYDKMSISGKDLLHVIKIYNFVPIYWFIIIIQKTSELYKSIREKMIFVKLF